MSAAQLAAMHLEEALDALRTHARRPEEEHGRESLRVALRAVQRAQAAIEEMLR